MVDGPTPFPPSWMGHETTQALAHIYAHLANLYDRLGAQGGQDAPRYHRQAAYARGLGQLYQP
jgi:hypothetical protein